MEPYAEFTTRVATARVVWPVCFAKEFLHCADQCEIAKLCDHFEHACGLSSHGTGLPWECVVRIGIAVVALRSTFVSISPLCKDMLGLPQSCRGHHFYVSYLDVSIENPEAARIEVKKLILDNLSDYSFPLLMMAYPTSGNFSIFDTITCFARTKDRFIFRGQQMKEGRDTPSTDAPFKGYLIRGYLTSKPCVPKKRLNWKYFSGEQMLEFLPYSLWQLIPSTWNNEVITKRLAPLGFR
jgi:hypothetical protein